MTIPLTVPAAGTSRRFLHHLNPLAKIAATAPAIAALILVRGLLTPLAFVAAALILLLLGARLSRRALAGLFLGLPALAAVMTVSFALWTDPAAISDRVTVLQVGDHQLYRGALSHGAGTSLRLSAMVLLSLIPGLTIAAPDLARSLTQQLRLPYRISYTAIAALQFVPRLGHDLALIQDAHRARGIGRGRGPLAAVGRWLRWVVPLLAGGIRHAERVALAMDARGFGAHPTRTERHLVPWRLRDTVFVTAAWALTWVALRMLWGR